MLAKLERCVVTVEHRGGDKAFALRGVGGRNDEHAAGCVLGETRDDVGLPHGHRGRTDLDDGIVAVAIDVQARKAIAFAVDHAKPGGACTAESKPSPTGDRSRQAVIKPGCWRWCGPKLDHANDDLRIGRDQPPC